MKNLLHLVAYTQRQKVLLFKFNCIIIAIWWILGISRSFYTIVHEWMNNCELSSISPHVSFPKLLDWLSISLEVRDSSILYSVDTGSGFHETSCSIDIRVCVTGVKRPGHEADYSYQSGADAKNTLGDTALWCFNRQGDNFTLNFIKPNVLVWNISRYD
jgi:hypothetical protein